jgi:Na+/phosphate symporter
MINKTIILITFTLAFLHFTPGLNALAEKLSKKDLVIQGNVKTLDQTIVQTINEIMEEEEVTLEEMQRYDDIATQSLTLKSDGTYAFDYSKAIQLGATVEEATNLKNGYESLDQVQVSTLLTIRSDGYQPPGRC